ncbi:MAG: hypothetical protein WCJ75_17040 [Desulfomonile sp.]
MDHRWYYSPDYRQLFQAIEAQTLWGNIRTTAFAPQFKSKKAMEADE